MLKLDCAWESLDAFAYMQVSSPTLSLEGRPDTFFFFLERTLDVSEIG